MTVFGEKGEGKVHPLKELGLQPLGNPQKQGAMRDVMINPKMTLGLRRGG
jgi:hypothetical protein